VPTLKVTGAMILYFIHIHGVDRDTFCVTFNTKRGSAYFFLGGGVNLMTSFHGNIIIYADIFGCASAVHFSYCKLFFVSSKIRDSQ